MIETRRFQILIFVLVGLGIIFLETLQTIPNGSSHYYMIDVGETQIVLNVWGTLHATGYPLYVILGNIITEIMTLFGMSPVVAPAIVSMFWGYILLGLIYVLALYITRRPLISAGLVLVFALTRSMWIHFIIAEIYTFGLMLQLILLVLALWGEPTERRIYWMAFIGGTAVAHHRAAAMMIPALLYATYPFFIANRRRLPRILIISLTLGLLGFAQYVYLYLRAGAPWVYGEPGTLDGLWAEFIGREASRFIGVANSWDALRANFNLVNDVLIRDLTFPGIVFGVIGLGIGLRTHHRATLTMILMGVAAYLFHVFVYSDVLSALILMMTFALAFGWLLLADVLMKYQPMCYAVPVVIVASTAGFFLLNHDFLYDLTHDRTGLETIEQLEAAPDGSTVMLAWGPRYFAASIGQLFLDDLQHIELVDHKDNYQPGILTPEYTLFNQPLSWWEARLNSPVYLQAAAPFIVQMNTAPVLADDAPDGISIAHVDLACESSRVVLDVLWQTSDVPQEDLSVFVHGLDAAGNIIGQGDQFAPVYGWRPLTSWLAGEQIRDIYVIDAENIVSVRFGLYHALAEGGFENVLVDEVICDDEA